MMFGVNRALWRLYEKAYVCCYGIASRDHGGRKKITNSHVSANQTISLAYIQEWATTKFEHCRLPNTHSMCMGYQPVGLYAVTSRLVRLKTFKDAGRRTASSYIGVIMNWVPAHFPADSYTVWPILMAQTITSIQILRKAGPPEWNSLIYASAKSMLLIILLVTRFIGWKNFISTAYGAMRCSMYVFGLLTEDGEWIPNKDGAI